MMRFHVDELKIDPQFLLKYLVTNENRDHIRNIAKRAVAQSSINQGDVKSLKVPLPSVSEQQDISEVLNACDACISALDHEACLHDELFRAMLEELMSGRLKVDALEKQR
jgi:type I restriction enzyme S subunit